MILLTRMIRNQDVTNNRHECDVFCVFTCTLYSLKLFHLTDDDRSTTLWNCDIFWDGCRPVKISNWLFHSEEQPWHHDRLSAPKLQTECLTKQTRWKCCNKYCDNNYNVLLWQWMFQRFSVKYHVFYDCVWCSNTHMITYCYLRLILFYLCYWNEHHTVTVRR